MNEPGDPQHNNLQTWYARVEKAIREVDPDHIMFLDGNTYSMDFTGFKDVLRNTVYSIHDYSNMGFPAGDPYTATSQQKETLRRQYERKVQWMKERKVPVSDVARIPLRFGEMLSISKRMLWYPGELLAHFASTGN